jgi:outer membrane biosynthesis protein TonB
MTDHFSNTRETDPDNIDRKSDFMLFGFIIILIIIVAASYFSLYPDEFKLKIGTAVEKPVTQPVPAPATSKQAALEPVAPEQTAPEPAAPEQAVPAPIAPEQAASEPATPEQAAPEPIAPEQVVPEPIAPEQVAPEPIAPEQAAPEPIAPEQVVPEPVASNMDLPQANKTTSVWAVNLISLPTQSSARRITDQLKTEGVETEVVLINIKNRAYYRVRIPNLTSKQEADEAHAAFKDNPAYKGTWINRYRK